MLTLAAPDMAQAVSETSQKVGDEAKGWLTVLFLVVAGFAALPVIGRLDVGRGLALAALGLVLGGLGFAPGGVRSGCSPAGCGSRRATCARRSTASGRRSGEPWRSRAESSSGRSGWSLTAATGGCSRSKGNRWRCGTGLWV